MITVSLWLLIAISTGSYNYGNTTVIDRFQTQQDCVSTMKYLNDSSISSYRCVPAKVVRFEGNK